jgi:cytochrome b subunit of formate dehydrogenase
VLWENGLDVRGVLHRAAAVAMLVALVGHLIHVVIDRRARACIAKMRPGMEDLKELGERMSYYIGRRRTPPAAPDLGYPEKMEYLALMWGILVMTVTGFALWFDDFALHYGPKWITDLATVIHFYEAILATLAIIVWHFYFVIFDPVVYPMDTAWLNGQAHRGRLLERQAHVSQEPPPPKGK